MYISPDVRFCFVTDHFPIFNCSVNPIAQVEASLKSILIRMDGVEHPLFYCLESNKFWSDLKLWMEANLNFGFEFTFCEILFGFPNYSVPDVEILKILILMGKWYLNNSKSKDKPILFFEFLIILREKLELMIGGAAVVGREKLPWQRALYKVL